MGSISLYAWWHAARFMNCLIKPVRSSKLKTTKNKKKTPWTQRDKTRRQKQCTAGKPNHITDMRCSIWMRKMKLKHEIVASPITRAINEKYEKCWVLASKMHKCRSLHFLTWECRLCAAHLKSNMVSLVIVSILTFSDQAIPLLRIHLRSSYTGLHRTFTR